MDDTTILGSVLGQLGQTAKKAGQQAVKLPIEMSRDLGEQVGYTPAKQDTNENKALEDKSKWQSDEDRIKFLKGLYGSAEQNPSDKSAFPASAYAKATADKEEQKELMALRNQLHKEVYYDPTFNPKNPPTGEEERPAEKVEIEKKKEMQELEQKDAKKPPPLAVVRERNKAEMFRGAAG